MHLVYFAAVREAAGCDGEAIAIPAEVQTVGELIDHLAGSDTRYAKAFADRTKLRFALDQQMVKAGAAIGNAQELAIFPPVTGG